MKEWKKKWGIELLQLNKYDFKAFFQELMDIFEQIGSWNSSLETIILFLIKENEIYYIICCFLITKWYPPYSSIFIVNHFFSPKTQSRLVFWKEEMKQCEGITWNFLCICWKGEQVGLLSKKAKERCRWKDILSWISYSSPFPISRSPLSSETSL